MTPEQLIAHVVEPSIARALRGESYLDPAVLEIKGFSTPTQRHLVSNLAHGVSSYLEVGVFFGGTFCAAISRNDSLTAIGVENWSQDFSERDVETSFISSLKLHRGDANVCLIMNDCFDPSTNRQIPKSSVDFYFYDGHHDRFPQSKALPHFIDCMSDVFLWMVDDTQWQSVREGTAEGFATLKDRIRIEKEWNLDEGRPDSPIWHNGVRLFVISKL